MRKLVADAGLDPMIWIESAGTSAHHVGEPADPRAYAAARRRGFELKGRAQQFSPGDFDRLHFALAMDGDVLRTLEELPASGGFDGHLSLLRDFDPGSPPESDVPDPYYGGERGFDEVLDLCEAACRGLLAQIQLAAHQK
jgi:protein-tyrosine phosphatase